MPPRFAYWTILIDNGPTAFRARDPQELLPTLNQLKRTNKHVTMKWFSGGKLWDSPEAARESRWRQPANRRTGVRPARGGSPHRTPQAFQRRGPTGPPIAGSKGPRPARPAGASRRRKRRDDEPPDRD